MPGFPIPRFPVSRFQRPPLKFDWTDFHEFFTRHSVVDSFSAVWVTPYPTSTPILGERAAVKFRFFDFAIFNYLTSKLSTDVLYLLSV